MLSILVVAQDKVPGIIVELSSGESVEFRIGDNPQVFFDGNIVTIKTDYIQVDYNLTEFDLVRLGEVDNITSIKSIKEDNVSIEIDKDYIRLNGFNANDVLKLVSLTGEILSYIKIPYTGSITISTSFFPKGITIITIGNQTIKISKQ